MTGDIPQWAIDRADELGAMIDRMSGAQAYRNAFARYIAEHEVPPVDPLLIEARQVAGDAMAAYVFPDGQDQYSSGTINVVRTGNGDDTIQIAVALAALKRGMELAELEREAKGKS